MLRINNLTISTKAPKGTVVGSLALLDASLAAMPAHYILTQGCAGFFDLSGAALLTTNVIPPGIYSVHVSAVGTTIRWKENAYFAITVTAT